MSDVNELSDAQKAILDKITNGEEVSDQELSELETASESVTDAEWED
jgi:hypothetical protein